MADDVRSEVGIGGPVSLRIFVSKTQGAVSITLRRELFGVNAAHARTILPVRIGLSVCLSAVSPRNGSGRTHAER